MQGKILILDAIATNRIVLKVKLSASFYSVTQATTIRETIDLIRLQTPDLIITGLSLPDGSAADLAQQVHSLPGLENVPILGIGGRAQSDIRMQSLEAGLQDVLMRPIDDILLLGRIRSLIRAHSAVDEWRLRDGTSQALGLAEPPAKFDHDLDTKSETILVSEDRAVMQHWLRRLKPLLGSDLRMALPRDCLRSEKESDVLTCFVFALPDDPGQVSVMLQCIATLRANGRSRDAGVLVLHNQSDPAQAAAALDLGADDVMAEGFEPTELALRLKSLLRRKQMAKQMRATVRTGLQAAVFDSLTGLHNRRFAMPHLARIAEHAFETDLPFAVMVADLDHFKTINDRFGHPAGDAVLVETARRLRDNLRAMDLVARIGGEEFLIAMPNTTLGEARAAAARLCNEISAKPFTLPAPHPPLSVTISIGLALGCLPDHFGEVDAASSEKLIAAADKALYAAKVSGRNQVTVSRPAA